VADKAPKPKTLKRIGSKVISRSGSAASTQGLRFFAVKRAFRKSSKEEGQAGDSSLPRSSSCSNRTVKSASYWKCSANIEKERTVL
jgi:hypothetical protein